MLLRGLPEEGALQTAVRGTPLSEVWTVDRELMAQVVELVSVAATTRHRLRKPVEVKRPRQRQPAVSPGEAARRMGVPVVAR